MRLAWATDIHLDHTCEPARRQSCQAVQDQADALVVSDDIAAVHTVSRPRTEPSHRCRPSAYGYDVTITAPFGR